MSNIFQYTPLTYHQTPDALIATGVIANLTPSALRLYTLLLYNAQRLTSTIINLTAADVTKVGVAINQVKDARENLVDNKLIAATRTRDGYRYEILDPISGTSLEQIVNLHNVDPDIVEEYFLDHLASFDPQDSSYQHLQSRCPFCDHKMRLTPFHVSFANGGGFKCNECGVTGGVVDFEILAAVRNGEELDRNRGYARARAGLLSAGRRVAKLRTEEIAKARAML